MPKRKTTEQFKNEVFELVGNEYMVLGEYIKSDKKIKMKHEKCGHEYYVQPNNFLSGNRCPKCNGKIKKTTEEFKKEVYDLVGDEYKVLGKYKNTNTKIKIKHNKCGHIYEVKPYSFLEGNRCPECGQELINFKNTKTTEQFKQEVFDLVCNEYSLLGEYTKSSVEIKMKHNKCGNIYEVKPNDFLQGRRCPICTKKERLKQKDVEFKQKVYKLVGDEYTFLEDYKGVQTKIKVRHNTCGNEYYVRPHDFIKNGTRCPICRRSSKGEQKIAAILKSMKIRYCTEKTFEDLKDKILLRFDFYLPEYNLLIEYDGHHHFKPVRFNGISEEVAEENFKNQKIRDKMKNKYCKENNIKLLRIKYTDFDKIRKILKEELK